MTEDQSESNFLRKLGERYLRSGKFKKARDSLLVALIINPGDILTLQLLASAFFFLGEDDQALHYFSLCKKTGCKYLIVRGNYLPPDKIVENVFLETYRFTVFTEKDYYYHEITSRQILNHPLVKLLLRNRKVLKVPETREVIEKRCVLLGGDSNYFHWMILTLPRLQEYMNDPHLQKLPLVVNCPLQPFQSETLKLMGISSDQLLQLEGDSIYRFSSLRVLTRATFQNVLDTRDQLMSTVSSKRNLRLFLARGKSYRRNLLNEEELFEKLTPLGFTKVEPGKLSVKEQMELFASAEIIVGTHDAGFANLLFAQKGTQVLELTHKDNRMNDFTTLAELNHLSFKRYKGDTDPSVDYKNAYVKQMANFTVDVDEVMSIVRVMIGTS